MSTITLACGDEPAITAADEAIITIDSLCSRPAQLVDHVNGEARAVLLLHAEAYDLAAVQKALRMADIDPLGAQLWDQSGEGNQRRLEVTIAGLESRANAFAGSEPEHAKPVLPGAVTRRGLFSPPRPVYLAAPMVDHGTCAAGDGCRACVTACPREAYRWHQGRIHFNKDACEPCGLCVTTCPTAAIENPSVTPAMLAAQVSTVVEHADGPVGVRFACSRATETMPMNDWHDIVVPCTGMVPGVWLLTALLMGAGSATALLCTPSGCPLGLDTAASAAIDFARTALEEAQQDPAHVPPTPAEVLEEFTRIDLDAAFSRHGSVEVLTALAGLTNVPIAFSHPGAGLGVVTIDPAACTLCAQCAQTCPTDALSARYAADSVDLSFDAGSCTACMQCTAACPELARGAISVATRLDLPAILSGRHVVNRGAVLTCDSCGKPIAPSPMMARIGDLLGDGFEDTMTTLTRRCMECRGLS